MSIRLRVIVLITAITALLSLCSVAVGIGMSRSYLLKTIEEDMDSSAHLAADMVSGRIELLKAELQNMALRLGPLESGAAAELLKAEGEERQDYWSLGILYRDGQVITVHRHSSDTPPREDPLAERAFAGETVLSTTGYSQNGAFILRAWVPINEEKILVVTLPGMLISDMVSHFSIWNSGNIFILDKQALIIASKEAEMVKSRFNYQEDPRGNKSMARVFTRMKSGQSGQDRYSYGGVERLCSFLPIPDSDGWSLALTCPIAESPISQIEKTFFICALIFLGLGLTAAIITAAFIERPFVKIREQRGKLEELKQEAAAAAEAKGRFLANMNHEVRGSMNVVLGMTEMIQREEPPQEIREKLETLREAGYSLLNLMDDTLDLSKIESGKMEIIENSYFLESLLNDVIYLIRDKAQEQSLDFECYVDRELPKCLLGDEARIRQILVNILNNAVKHSDEGRIVLELEGEGINGGEILLRCRISDNGQGIEEENLDTLFSDYSRFDARKSQGTGARGLTLAITKALCEMMGGTIEVKSEQGRGSVFSLTIPQKIASDEAFRPPVSPAGEGEAPERMLRYQDNLNKGDGAPFKAPQARVLIVDDMPSNIIVVAGLIAPYGMRVERCLSGEQAVELVREREFDIIFMDHMMPTMDGIEAAASIRRFEAAAKRRAAVIIALTANAMVGMRETFLSSGFDDFLPKPIDPVKLHEILQHWVPEDKKQ